MKIIDLLNKINNEEEVPAKIKFNEVEFEYNKDRKEYIHEISDFHSETLLFEVMRCHYISEIFEKEVELIEDKIYVQEIEEVDEERYIITDVLKKINELVQAVKQLNKKLEEE